jgi:2-polyprenyl-6-methoxyphenol hydroxylase-like FAD-dependent oxidoreductase
MPQQNGLTSSETLPRPIGVHILGAGPVGLLMTALLQSNERFSVHLYEKATRIYAHADGAVRVVRRRRFGCVL